MREGLPRGWASAALSELVSAKGLFVDGDWVETKDQDPEGDIRLTQLADIGDGHWKNRSSRYMTSAKARELRCTALQRGDVLVARMPDPLGRSCVFPGDPNPCVTVVDVSIIRPGIADVSTAWLSNFINASPTRDTIHSLRAGSTRKRISRKNLATIHIPVPPFAEQQRIVEAIESYFTRLDDAVATLERVQRNLERYRASVLKAAVEGRLVPTEAELARAEGREYEPASALLARVRSERPLIAPGALRNSPAGWEWTTLDQITLSISGGNAATATSTSTTRRVLRSSAVRQRSIDFQDYRFLPEGAAIPPDRYIAEGDLLFTRLSGTLDYVGNAAVVPPILGPRYEFPDRIFRARVKAPINPHYVAMCFGVADLRRELEAAARSSAGHQRISLSDLRSFKVPLPPVAEQTRIVAEVDRLFSATDTVERTAAQNVTKCVRLRQSILKWAFEGRLVDQGPSDEPASALLERIKAERASAAIEKTKRKPAPKSSNGRSSAKSKS